MLKTNSDDEIKIINFDGQVTTIKINDEIETLDHGNNIVTTTANNAVTPVLQTSCNKDVAVAMLVGLLEWPNLSRLMVQGECGVIINLLLAIQNTEGSLLEMLSHFRTVTNQVYAFAVSENESSEIVKGKKEAADYFGSLADKAFMYMLEIDNELGKGEDSSIKIDEKTSDKKGVTHMTLSSVNQWAKKKYGISIFDEQEQCLSPENTPAQQNKQNIEEELDHEGGLTRTVANNVLTTFGFLVEAFAKTATGYGGEKPNASNIAKHIAKLAATASGQEVMDNQSYESIRRRIKQAIDTKNSNLE